MEWPSSQVSVLFLSTYTRHFLVLANEMKNKRLRSGLLFSYSVNTQTIYGNVWPKQNKTCSSVTCSTFILHSISPSLCVIYLSVRGRIDSLLYSRPLKPRGDSPCQAAGSNEKLKEHINSSIWGHEDENSCQRPARNNWSHNAAPLYVSEVTGVKQQLKTWGSKNTESWQSLIGALHRKLSVKIRLSVSYSKQAINMSRSKLRLEQCCYLVLSELLRAIRQHFK